MEFWIKFWAFFFFLSVAIFAILAVTVTIGGFFDIRALFKNLLAEHKDQSLYEKDPED